MGLLSGRRAKKRSASKISYGKLSSEPEGGAEPAEGPRAGTSGEKENHETTTIEGKGETAGHEEKEEAVEEEEEIEEDETPATSAEEEIEEVEEEEAEEVGEQVMAAPPTSTGAGPALQPGAPSVPETTGERIQEPEVEPHARKPVVSRGESFNMCPICMGMIKQGLATMVCTCRRTYHVSCARRLGKCPACSSDFTDDMKVGGEEKGEEVKVNYEDIPVPKLRLTAEDKLELLTERLLLGEVGEDVYKELRRKYERELASGATGDDELFKCPECGRSVERDAARCECGAVFSGMEGFRCPECNSIVQFDARFCRNCGVRFTIGEDFGCPSCGRKLEHGARSCQCGAKFSDGLVEGFNCPECGRFLESDAERCPSCGTEFL